MFDWHLPNAAPRLFAVRTRRTGTAALHWQRRIVVVPRALMGFQRASAVEFCGRTHGTFSLRILVKVLHTNFFLQLLYIKQTYVLKPFKGLIGGGVSGQSTCFGRQWLNTEIPNLNFLIERFDLMAIFWVK